jgi:hypothetical protein
MEIQSIDTFDKNRNWGIIRWVALLMMVGRDGLITTRQGAL